MADLKDLPGTRAEILQEVLTRRGVTDATRALAKIATLEAELVTLRTRQRVVTEEVDRLWSVGESEDGKAKELEKKAALKKAVADAFKGIHLEAYSEESVRKFLSDVYGHPVEVCGLGRDPEVSSIFRQVKVEEGTDAHLKSLQEVGLELLRQHPHLAKIAALLTVRATKGFDVMQGLELTYIQTALDFRVLEEATP